MQAKITYGVYSYKLNSVNKNKEIWNIFMDKSEPHIPFALSDGLEAIHLIQLWSITVFY